MSDAIRAVVQKVIQNGKHGAFAVALSDEMTGTITFSLNEEVWSETSYPETGMYVILSSLRKKRSGWRALNGRFLMPSDEQQPAKRKQ